MSEKERDTDIDLDAIEEEAAKAKMMIERSTEESGTGVHVPTKGGISLEGFDFAAYAAEANENVASGEIKVSRVTVMQPGSPEIAQEVPGYKTGMMIDSVTRDILSREVKSPWLVGKVDESALITCYACFVVPCFKLPTEFIKWKNRKTEGRGWHFKTLNRNDHRVREGVWPASGGTWGTKEGQEGAPPVTENCNYMCIVLDGNENENVIDPGIIFTFAKTSFNAGRDLTTSIAKGWTRRLPAFQVGYWIYTIKTQDDSGNTYAYMNVAPGSIIKKASVVRAGYDWHKRFSDPENGKNIQAIYLSTSDQQLVEESSVGVVQDEFFDRNRDTVDSNSAPTGKQGNDPF